MHRLHRALFDSEASLERKSIGISPVLEIWTPRIRLVTLPFRVVSHARKGLALGWLEEVAAVLSDPSLLPPAAASEGQRCIEREGPWVLDWRATLGRL